MQRFSFASDGAHFLLDGAPFQIRSGELHPARIPVEYWAHRIQMVRAMGMNTIALYVMWNHHESRAGVFDFHSGNRDIAGFIRLCQQQRMWVLLRPGPYVCAEWDLGGLPAYLLREPDIRLRTDATDDARYMAAVERYIGALAPLVVPLTIDRGGPILMLQIENEFGSYASNPAYLEALRQLWLRHGIAGPFYTEDGLAQLRQNRTTVQGGAIALSNGDAAQLAAVRREFPHVPAFAGEVYPGWLTHWGDAALQGTAVELDATLDALMQQQLSFNLYVIHGGTNFGFTAGANTDPASGAYQPDITSYDYAAPISEQGVATPKYLRYRALIGAYLREALPAVPAPLPTLARQGRDALEPRRYASLWDNLPAPLPLAQTAEPQSFETYGQNTGFVLYRHRLQRAPGAARLELQNLHDYATVHIDGQYEGAVSRAGMPPWYAQLTHATYEAPLALADAAPDVVQRELLLDVLVEGMGRVNYGNALADRKGLLGPAMLHETAGARRALRGWEVFLLPMADGYVDTLREVCSDPQRRGLFFRAVLSLDACGDTYLDMSRWTKGVVWVNGHNLGRYWNIGPQQRLFCPAPWLKRGDNLVTIFDLHQIEPQPVELARTLT